MYRDVEIYVRYWIIENICTTTFGHSHYQLQLKTIEGHLPVSL